MNRCIEKVNMMDRCSTDSGNPKKTMRKSQTNKEKWIQHYANRIFELWQRWQGQLGIACDYLVKIKKDLAEFYEDPLKKTFIEATY